MSSFLTQSSVLQCPHGGPVTAGPGSSEVKVDGAPVLRASDTFAVTGCPFPQSPCVTVEWAGASGRTKVTGESALRSDDTGVCKSGAGAAQGMVIVSSTQGKASGS
jgi:uncharacterized Zn-binding protein involved in type VI secretion